MPDFQRRHYQAIAAAIIHHTDPLPTASGARAVAEALAGVFARDNDRFDRVQFLAACGIAPRGVRRVGERA